MTVQKKVLVIIPIAFIMALGLTGCGKKASEKAAENALEKATNGQANVDVSNNTVTINTNAGSYQGGENLSLPTGFPDDIYVVEGTITGAITTTETNGYTISINSTQSISDLKTLYEQKLRDDGWNITLNMVITGGATLGGEKGNRYVSVGINPGDEGKNIVVISTYQSTN